MMMKEGFISPDPSLSPKHQIIPQVLQGIVPRPPYPLIEVADGMMDGTQVLPRKLIQNQTHLLHWWKSNFHVDTWPFEKKYP